VSVRRFRDALAEIDRTYRGAGSVDAAAMRMLLSDLEAEGGLTPVPVFREFQALTVELDAVLRRILEDHRHADDCVDHLGELRKRFASRTANPRAQYYDAFKSKYDLCGLVLALAGTESMRPVVNRLLHPKAERDDRAAISFSEIRYRE
jgi:hypothetical protein